MISGCTHPAVLEVPIGGEALPCAKHTMGLMFPVTILGFPTGDKLLCTTQIPPSSGRVVFFLVCFNSHLCQEAVCRLWDAQDSRTGGMKGISLIFWTELLAPAASPLLALPAGVCFRVHKSLGWLLGNNLTLWLLW